MSNPPPAEPDRRKANDNPWYVLATLHGEQLDRGYWDRDLHARNRRTWNRFMAGLVDDDERQRLADLKDDKGKLRFSPEDLTPYSDEEKTDLLVAFKARGHDALPEGAIDFGDTDFSRSFIAEGLLFSGVASFSGAIFSGLAHFQGATFSDAASFEGAIFAFYAVFKGATFSGMTDFRSATFSEPIDFRGTTFSEPIDFRGTTFSKLVDFQGAIFSSQAHFINASFTSNTIFAGCEFKTEPPDLRGADLHEASEWHDVEWPPIPPDREQAQEHLYAYEHLKKEMERLKKHEDEHVFFTRELRCREVIAGFPSHLVSRLYGGLSAYGWSILRPLQAMLALWAAGLMALWPLGGPDYSPLAQHTAMGLSFANLLALLPLRKEVFATTLETLSPLAHVVSAGQMLAGIVLLFLLGLALRNRFRMK